MRGFILNSALHNKQSPQNLLCPDFHRAQSLTAHKFSLNNYFNRTTSRFFGSIVSILNCLCMLDAKSSSLVCSPWTTITFLGLGLTLFINSISSSLSQWPDNPSSVSTFNFTTTFSPSTLTSFSPLWTFFPRVPSD